MSGLKNNRTLEILRKAEEGKYGVIAQCVYDANQALAFVRGCEAKRAPGILQIFPVTLKLGGGPFLQYLLTIAHTASVPISVHMDHATDAEHLEQAIELGEQGIKFDSVMVDASHAETDEENIAIAVPFIKRLNALGIATEVELGRLEGGEAGLREISGAMLTDPSKAEAFMKGTGADILAPSIGNLHGSYKFIKGGPQFRQDILKDLQKRFPVGKAPYLCMHGTDELPDEMWLECIANGATKFNINSWLRDPYNDALSQGLPSKPMPEAIDAAMAALEKECARFNDLLGATGKADE